MAAEMASNNGKNQQRTTSLANPNTKTGFLNSVSKNTGFGLIGTNPNQGPGKKIAKTNYQNPGKHPKILNNKKKENNPSIDPTQLAKNLLKELVIKINQEI